MAATKIVSGTSQHLLAEVAEHAVGVEVLLGDRAGGARVPFVVLADRLCARERLLRSPEHEQALAGRQMLREAGVLDKHGLSGRQIADAPVAEPAAPRLDIDALRNRE